MTRFALTLFTFTFTRTLAVLLRINACTSADGMACRQSLHAEHCRFLAIDQIRHRLRSVGGRRLDEGCPRTALIPMALFASKSYISSSRSFMSKCCMRPLYTAEAAPQALDASQATPPRFW